MAENKNKTEKEYRKASQLRVIWRRFRKHKMGLVGAIMFAIMFFLAIFADFIAPYEWERGAEALPDNGPTEGAGKIIENEGHLIPVFGPKAMDRQAGTARYPDNPDPDYQAEAKLHSPAGTKWKDRNVGAPIDDNDTARLDKTVLNATFEAEIPAIFKDGRFLNINFFQTYVRVVNKEALLQWDIWFEDLTDMCAIRMAPYSPTEAATMPLREYPIVSYASGILDTEDKGGTKNSFSLSAPLYEDAEGDVELIQEMSPVNEGINRLILLVIGVNRESLSVDVGWSDMVYSAGDLGPEDLSQLLDVTGRDNTSTPGPGEPYNLMPESYMRTNYLHYGLNASGEVRYVPIDDDFGGLPTYHVPVQQAMWRAESGTGYLVIPIQDYRGWSYGYVGAVEIPPMRYGLPFWSNSKAIPPVGNKFLGLPFVADYILGTDLLGHDILTGLIYGARVSLFIGFLAIGLSTGIGVVLGAISGYYAGLVDEFFMRFTDIIISIPSFFLILLAVSVFMDAIREYGAWGAPTVIALILGLLGWASTARIVRAEFLALRGLEYAEAAKVLGASDRRIIFRHLLPNAMAPVIVNATIGMAFIILIEAGLAFLGVGNPQTPSWGRMLQLSQDGMRFAWWAAIIPGLAIFVAVLAFNMLGDALRDALDPRLKE